MNLQDTHINELRKIGQKLKVKDYNSLAKSELVKAIRLAQPELTTQAVIDKMKEAHSMLFDLIKQRQSKGQGFSSYIGAHERHRALISQMERLV
jgi:hypothetical protein